MAEFKFSFFCYNPIFKEIYSKLINLFHLNEIDTIEIFAMNQDLVDFFNHKAFKNPPKYFSELCADLINHFSYASLPLLAMFIIPFGAVITAVFMGLNYISFSASSGILIEATNSDFITSFKFDNLAPLSSYSESE